MKKFRCLLAVLLILSLLTACGSSQSSEQSDGDTMILATTYPMYYLTQRITDGVEGVTVELMVSEAVSCLHDYTLTTGQMKMIEQADFIVMNGAGLEEFMASALKSVPEDKVVESAEGVSIIDGDPHIWLDPECFAQQGETIAAALAERYPDHAETFSENVSALTAELTDLKTELCSSVADLTCRELITFHDGFSYFAQGLDLTIAAAIEEEEGAEASAAELKEICDLIGDKNIPAIFVERNGSTNAAEIISRETGVQVYTLNTMMDGQTDYFTAMRDNVAAVKEALS